MAQQFPSLQDAGISSIINDFVDDLFGDDGYADDECSLVRAPVSRFIDTLLANSWNRLRKWVKADKTKLGKQREHIKQFWDGMYNQTHYPMDIRLF
jgi:hypothetical protein